VSDELLRALLTVLFGSLAGGLTNSVAIWMLFHPYRPPRILGREISFLQGAVPKNQARLASAIGRTVGGRLLTEEDLTRVFTNAEFRRAFDERLSAFLEEILEVERPSLRELLPPALAAEIEGLVDEAVSGGLERFERYLDSPEFEELVEARTGDVVEAVEDESLAGVLTPAREDALTSAAEEWLADAVESEGFRNAVDDYLDRAARTLLSGDRTFEETLPLGLVGSLEKAISGYLPLAIERLGGLLEDPEARARFESLIHDLLHRFLRDLKFHQRVVARLVVTEDTVDRVLDTIEAEGAERISEMLQDPAVQDAMARGVNDAIVDFLRRPVADVLGDPDSREVVEARDTLARWVVGMAREPETRTFLVEKLRTGIERAGARTWGDLFERVPPEKITAWLIRASRSEGARRLYRRASRKLGEVLLDRPLGRPADWLPDEAPERIERGLGDPLWEWLETQVPDVVERLDVAQRVEQKVMEYPTPKMEELVRRVTDRELKMIVRLGYLLGAGIGAVLLGVDWLLGG